MGGRVGNLARSERAPPPRSPRFRWGAFGVKPE